MERTKSRNKKMETLSFFSGICGLEKGIQDYINVKCHCDMNKYCKNIINKRYPSIDYQDNICNFPKEKYSNINLIVGGFPCQDISNAGKGKGLNGKRSGLVWELLKIIEYYKPEFVFLENVSNLKNKGLKDLLLYLDNLGYDTKWSIIKASNVGALHRRARTFILSKNRKKKCNIIFTPKKYNKFNWEKEPNIERIVNDPNKERIKCLGNAVVPDQSRLAFNMLCGNNNNMDTIRNIEKCWNNSISKYKLYTCNVLPSVGFYSNKKLYITDFDLSNNVNYPFTIQRFKPTHSLPTPTATDYISRKPTNKLKNRAFRPGVNKSVNLNRWIEMFPNKNTLLPELDNEGYLVDDNIKGIVPNPQWVEWLMGFPLDWTE